ncbi:hypothetical protein VKT23_009601 [Stygiomarasmius scandens]|uniref:Uncharacterized protein n=1 Tax=Marasmiellus scandens TaxID=2682957 RepID=A0ABR1JIW1_9AGAR
MNTRRSIVDEIITAGALPSTTSQQQHVFGRQTISTLRFAQPESSQAESVLAMQQTSGQDQMMDTNIDVEKMHGVAGPENKD